MIKKEKIMAQDLSGLNQSDLRLAHNFYLATLGLDYRQDPVLKEYIGMYDFYFKDITIKKELEVSEEEARVLNLILSGIEGR